MKFTLSLEESILIQNDLLVYCHLSICFLCNWVYLSPVRVARMTDAPCRVNLFQVVGDTARYREHPTPVRLWFFSLLSLWYMEPQFNISSERQINMLEIEEWNRTCDLDYWSSVLPQDHRSTFKDMFSRKKALNSSRSLT